MILNVELLRAWDDHTWDLVELEVAPDDSNDEFYSPWFDESEDEAGLAKSIASRYQENWIPENEDDPNLFFVSVYSFSIRSDDDNTWMGNFIYAGGNLTQSDLNTLRLMFGHAISSNDFENQDEE